MSNAAVNIFRTIGVAVGGGSGAFGWIAKVTQVDHP
jgi:hypothetical protein